MTIPNIEYEEYLLKSPRADDIKTPMNTSPRAGTGTGDSGDRKYNNSNSNNNNSTTPPARIRDNSNRLSDRSNASARG